jgi:hypothetical protein
MKKRMKFWLKSEFESYRLDQEHFLEMKRLESDADIKSKKREVISIMKRRVKV